MGRERARLSRPTSAGRRPVNRVEARTTACTLTTGRPLGEPSRDIARPGSVRLTFSPWSSASCGPTSILLGATLGLVVGSTFYSFLEDRWWVVRYLRARGDCE